MGAPVGGNMDVMRYVRLDTLRPEVILELRAKLLKSALGMLFFVTKKRKIEWGNFKVFGGCGLEELHWFLENKRVDR